MNEEPRVDSLGNIIGMDIPEYNIITPEDSIRVIVAKQEKQYYQWDKELRERECMT